MFFERRREEQAKPTEINETERHQSTERVLNDVSEILDMSEVQDALERLKLGRLPEVFDKAYVPDVESGKIEAPKKDSIPVVGLYRGEKLFTPRPSRMSSEASDFITLKASEQDADGLIAKDPYPIIGLNQSRLSHPAAPLTAIHEMAHIHQLDHPVDLTAYERHPELGPEEAEAYNVEAVVARILTHSRNKKWAKNTNLYNAATWKINSQRPVFPEPTSKNFPFK